MWKVVREDSLCLNNQHPARDKLLTRLLILSDSVTAKRTQLSSKNQLTLTRDSLFTLMAELPKSHYRFLDSLIRSQVFIVMSVMMNTDMVVPANICFYDSAVGLLQVPPRLHRPLTSQPVSLSWFIVSKAKEKNFSSGLLSLCCATFASSALVLAWVAPAASPHKLAQSLFELH